MHDKHPDPPTRSQLGRRAWVGGRGGEPEFAWRRWTTVADLMESE